jgi:hypothetical protein
MTRCARGRQCARGALLAALLASCAAPAAGAQASAHARPADANPVKEAVARAVSYSIAHWGMSPCGGHVAVVTGAASEAPQSGENSNGPPGEVAAMWATWRTPHGTNQFGDPPGSFTECVVHINRHVWPDWLADDRGFPFFCREIVHEYGHFAGYPDVGARPGTVQYEQPNGVRVPICERYRLLYGHMVFSGRVRAPRLTRLSPAAWRRTWRDTSSR